MRSLSYVQRVSLDFTGTLFPHAICLGDADNDKVNMKSAFGLKLIDSNSNTLYMILGNRQSLSLTPPFSTVNTSYSDLCLNNFLYSCS